MDDYEKLQRLLEIILSSVPEDLDEGEEVNCFCPDCSKERGEEYDEKTHYAQCLLRAFREQIEEAGPDTRGVHTLVVSHDRRALLDSGRAQRLLDDRSNGGPKAVVDFLRATFGEHYTAVRVEDRHYIYTPDELAHRLIALDPDVGVTARSQTVN